MMRVIVGRRSLPRAVRWAVVAAILLAGGFLAAAAPTVTAQLDRDTVALGETVTLSLIFNEAAPGGTPSLPALPGLRFEGVNQSSEISIVNGARSQRIIFNYTLSPTQEGTVVIPALQISVGGRVLSTQPVTLRVVKGAAAPGEPSLAFLRLVVNRTNVYVGETFPLQVLLFFQEIQPPPMPQVKADGFTLIPTPQGGQRQSTARVGNIVYNVLVLEMAATAVRPGDLTLGPAQCPVVALVPDPRGRSRDPFDFFGFGPRRIPRQIDLVSDPVTVRVQPLPTEGVPATFSGAIGTFQMKVTAGPTNLTAGDPITVKVELTGNGQLDALKLPEQPAWRDFKMYSPTSRTQPADLFGLSGTKTFDQVVVPENQEIRSLPPLQFSFFDPNARAYRTLTGPSFLLEIRAGGSSSPLPPTLTNATPSGERPPADDIVHIKPRLEGATPGRLLVRQPWFLALLALPPVIWAALLVARRRKEALANNPRLVRQRQVARRIRAGLQELRAHAAAQQTEPFFATVFRLLQEQLGERLDMPASAITEAVIDERLAGRGLPASALEALHELFQVCNQARYAPVQSSQELSALVPKLESALHDLQQLKM